MEVAARLVVVAARLVVLLHGWGMCLAVWHDGSMSGLDLWRYLFKHMAHHFVVITPFVWQGQVHMTARQLTIMLLLLVINVTSRLFFLSHNNVSVNSGCQKNREENTKCLKQQKHALRHGACAKWEAVRRWAGVTALAAVAARGVVVYCVITVCLSEHGSDTHRYRAPIFVIVTMDIGTGRRFLSPIPMSSVTGSVRRDRDSESLTLSERGGKWEGDQEREREKGRLNEGHGG